VIAEAASESSGETVTVEQVAYAIQEVAGPDATPEEIAQVIEEVPPEVIVEAVVEVAEEQPTGPSYPPWEEEMPGPVPEPDVDVGEIYAAVEADAGVSLEVIAEAASESSGETVTVEQVAYAIQEVVGEDASPAEIAAAIEEVPPQVVIEAVVDTVVEEPGMIWLGGDRDDASQQVSDIAYGIPGDGGAVYEPYVEDGGDECLTQAEVIETVEAAVESGVMDEAIEVVEEIATAEVVEAVTEAVVESEESAPEYSSLREIPSIQSSLSKGSKHLLRKRRI
jgi:hypothetical protein